LYPKESESAGISYTTSFITADWGSPVAGLYTYSLPASEHGMAGNFPVRIFEEDTRVYLDYIINSTGDLTLTVTEKPDYRFNGSIYLGV